MSDPVSERNRREFVEYKLASSLPDVLLVYGVPKIPGGATSFGFGISLTTDIDSTRHAMLKVFYTTPTRIYGLLHLETPSQLFFIGYKCPKCDRVFLVPEGMTDDSDVANSVRHSCHE